MTAATRGGGAGGGGYFLITSSFSLSARCFLFCSCFLSSADTSCEDTGQIKSRRLISIPDKPPPIEVADVLESTKHQTADGDAAKTNVFFWNLQRKGEVCSSSSSSNTTASTNELACSHQSDHLLGGVTMLLTRRRRRGTGPISLGLSHCLLTDQAREMRWRWRMHKKSQNRKYSVKPGCWGWKIIWWKTR